MTYGESLRARRASFRPRYYFLPRYRLGLPIVANSTSLKSFFLSRFTSRARARARDNTRHAKKCNQVSLSQLYIYRCKLNFPRPLKTGTSRFSQTYSRLCDFTPTVEEQFHLPSLLLSPSLPLARARVIFYEFSITSSPRVSLNDDNPNRLAPAKIPLKDLLIRVKVPSALLPPPTRGGTMPPRPFLTRRHTEISSPAAPPLTSTRSSSQRFCARVLASGARNRRARDFSQHACILGACTRVASRRATSGGPYGRYGVDFFF